MEQFHLQLDYYGLLNLHKALLEAKFHTNPENELISGSPLVAEVYAQVRELLIQNDETGQWQEWFQLKNRPDYRSRAILRMKASPQWGKADSVRKEEMARNFLSPFLYDAAELNAVLEELNPAHSPPSAGPATGLAL